MKNNIILFCVALLLLGPKMAQANNPSVEEVFKEMMPPIALRCTTSRETSVDGLFEMKLLFHTFENQIIVDWGDGSPKELIEVI
jgi:hypothetical protein